jgi:hypothetical protein
MWRKSWEWSEIYSWYDIASEILGEHSLVSMKRSSYADDINFIMRFPDIKESNSRNITALGEQPEKFSLQYVRWSWWFEYNGKNIHFLESDNNFVLLYDGRPLASIGYLVLEYWLFIHHIQWVYYDKLGVGHKRNKKYFPDLQSLNWREVLVVSVERIARWMWKDYVYIQAAADNASIWWRTDFAEKNYDDTADYLWYADTFTLEVTMPAQNKDHKWAKIRRKTHAYGKKISRS